MHRAVDMVLGLWFTVAVRARVGAAQQGTSMVSLSACHPEHSLSSTLPFCNLTLSVENRVNDLLERLTQSEKLGLMSADQSGIERLGIAPLTWSNECLHGVVVHQGGSQGNTGPQRGATVFPQPLGWAATFDTDLVHSIGVAISDESRALSNNGAVQGVDRPGFLSCWAPNMNIFRDPRWGRGSETYGEDPKLTASMVHSIVTGTQGPGAGSHSTTSKPTSPDTYVKIVSVCKHFVAYSLEEADGLSRFWFDANVSQQDLVDTYLPAFKACVEAGARGIMCSYNELNGTPMCANHDLLQGVLRDEFNFSGHVVSDCSAVSNIQKTQRVATTPENAAADALKSGTDMNCGNGYDALNVSLAKGLVTVADIDTALTRTLTGRFELGEFDPDSRNPFSAIPIGVVGSAEHVSLARRAAVESLVLLKNLAGAGGRRVLPLDPASLARVAVVGPHANDTLVQLGNYHGDAAGRVITPLEALTSELQATHVEYAAGCAIVGDGAWAFGDAVAAADAADVALVFLGSSSKGSVDGTNHLDTVEKESMDRTSLSLPGVQEDLLKALVSQTTTPIVLVLFHGGPIDVEWAQSNPQVVAILSCAYPGQEGGNAVVDVLLGKTSPAGRLPITWYFQSYTTHIRATDMRMRPWPGRTHRFVQVPVLYPFGHGLSYATFEYAAVSVERSAITGLASIELSVTNVGHRDGPNRAVVSDEVVLLFASPTSPTVDAADTELQLPNRKLLTFTRVRNVNPGETRRVVFTLAERDFQAVDTSGSWRSIAPRCWEISVGVPTGGAHSPAAVQVCP